MNKFDTDFDFFWDMINRGDNFTFARYADGEILLMRGVAVGEQTQAYRIDNWNAPNHMTKVGIELNESLNHIENNYYYAISSKSDSITDYIFLKERIKQKETNITFVNLWINANYIKTKQRLSKLKRDVILICNSKAQRENFPFPVKEINPFPNNCVSFWEENSDKYIQDLINKYENEENQLFFISCGPVSEIIIDKLYKNNPNNTYIDMGSSLDEFIHKNITRPYMDSNSPYSKEKSYF